MENRIDYDIETKELERLKGEAENYDAARLKSKKRKRVIVIGVTVVFFVIFLYLRLFNTHFEMIGDDGIRIKYSTAWFVKIPGEYNGKKITDAGSMGLDKVAPEILFLSYDEGIEKVYGATSDTLLHVSFPSSIKEINWNAFFGMESLRWVSFPEKVDSLMIEDYAFTWTSLKEVILPEGTIYLGDFAFAGCHNLENVEISNTVTYMGEHLLGGNRKLKTVKLPEQYDRLPEGLLYSCEELESVIWPSNLQSIPFEALEDSSFEGMSPEEMNLPKGVVIEPENNDF